MEEITWYREREWHFNADRVRTVTYYKLGKVNVNCLFLKVAVSQRMQKGFLLEMIVALSLSDAILSSDDGQPVFLSLLHVSARISRGEYRSVV